MPAKCREYAQRCATLAAKATLPQAKANFLDLAETWSRLADDAELITHHADVIKAVVDTWGKTNSRERTG